MLLLLLGVTNSSIAANREYQLSLTNISNVNFEHTYTAQLSYESSVGDIPSLVLNGECQFSRFEDSNSYVDNVSLNGSMFNINFKRRDTSSKIDGILTIHFYAKPTDESTSMRLYNININYTYLAMTSVDGGKIDGPDKNHNVGDIPSHIQSIYDAIPLKGSAVTYSWEFSKDKREWTTIETADDVHLYEMYMVSETSDYYRRKATDCEGNYAYSNVVEIFSMLSAGEIGIKYTDAVSTITLTNVKSPNSAGGSISWQSSTDLEVWQNIGFSSYNAIVSKPSTTTYYRRTITSNANDTNDQPVVCHSNIVCYATENPAYIQTSTYHTSTSTVDDNIYYDGLGRPIQQVGVGAAPSGNDIISTTMYDNKGRKANHLLPFSYDNDGMFAHNAIYKSNTFNNDDFASSVTAFDGSPLDRVVRTYKPGEVYQGVESQHYIEYGYDLNAENEVKHIKLEDNGSISVIGCYSTGILFKNEVADEDGARMITYTDVEGKTILERRYIATGVYADTYYVYDTKSRLRWVITPKGSDMLTEGVTYLTTDNIAKELCYTYEYDNEDRIICRHIPGSEPSYYTYDEVGRISSFSDATLQSMGITGKYVYDELDRIVRIQYESDKKNFIQQYYRYDTYTSIPKQLQFMPEADIATATDRVYSINGKLTYERTFEVYDADNSSSLKEIARTYYYDKRDRVIQTVTLYPYNILCRTSVKYDYVGNPLITLERYTYGTKTLIIQTDRTFDERSRQLTEQTTIDGTVISNATFSYDELGRMQRLELSDNVKINTSYNLQGWVSSIVSKLISSGDAIVLSDAIFSEHLSYYDTVDENSSPRYSGKVSEQRWSYSNNRNDYKGLSYTYDDMGRMIDAQSFVTSLPSTPTSLDDSRESVVYDKNSNILQLNNVNGLASTYRTYTLNGNKVSNITINRLNTGVCSYDNRGNMTKNTEAGLEILYNLCNLPKQITATDGTTIKYTYFADGIKFKAVDATGNGFAYTGSLRWSIENGVLIPESMAITGGRAVCDSTNMWSANYYITDHLGSVRAVTDAEGEVLDTYDYMPYGSEFTTDTDNITDYRFTGKEKQLMFGNSNVYDSFARFQNTYGRFMSIDPKAESFYHISPYTYCAGDPVNLVDPDGKDIYRFDKDTGEFICEEYTNDKFDQIGKYKYEDGKYVLERKSNGKPKLLVSRVAKGILFPGANFKENQGEFIIGGTHGLTEQEFQLFVFELSYLSEVELSGYYFANKGETSTSYILMGKYKRNTRTESYKPIIDYEKKDLYDPIASWHTHPENIGPSRQDFDSAEGDYKYHPTIKRHFIIARDEYNRYWYIPY